MPNEPNNATVVETCARRIRAMQAYVDRQVTVGVNGRKHTHADVVAVYQRCLDGRSKLANLRAQIAETLRDVGEAEAARVELDGSLKAWVRSEFGPESTEANDFGFPAPRKPVMTVERKMLAVQRAKATRKARRTLGKRQREGIRGVSGDVGPPVPRGTRFDGHAATE